MGGVFSSKRKDADDLSKSKPSNTNNSGTKRNSQKVTQVVEQGGFKKSVLSVLLLGTGETGKSTLFKQIELINGVGIIKENERAMWTSLIHGNVISDMKTLIAIAEELNLEMNDEEMIDLIHEVFELPDQNYQLNQEMADKLLKLWNYGPIQQSYENRDQALDSAEYLFTHLERICDPSYSATVDDVLHCRVKTLGVHQVEMTMEDNLKFRLVDVGGQRSERRKWLELMSEVDAVIFMSSLAEFDQDCYEEKGCWRVKEALDTFEKVINNKLFKNVPFVLMLNKRDLFEKKLAKKSFKKYFEDYEGDEKDVQSCIDHISKLYLKRSKEHPIDNILVRPHCAIDKDATELMFKDVKNFIIEQYKKK